MSVYPDSWTALVAAFNAGPYSELRGPAWGEFIRDGWGHDHVNIRQINTILTSREWSAQHAYVEKILRAEMPFMAFAWLEATHTFDLNELKQHVANPYNGVLGTLVPNVRADDRIGPNSKLKNCLINLAGMRMQITVPLVLRAINIELWPILPDLDGEVRQKTISNWQSLVRKIVNGHRRESREQALNIIESHPALVTTTHRRAS